MFKMWKLLVITLLVAVHFADLTQAKYGKFDDSKENNAETPKGKAYRGLGISAWGLIFLIVAVILLGVGAYYVAIFYPLLCKKERTLDPRVQLLILR